MELFGQYHLEIYSEAFDQTITGVTTVYPPVEFIDIDTLSILDDRITLDRDVEKDNLLAFRFGGDFVLRYRCYRI